MYSLKAKKIQSNIEMKDLGEEHDHIVGIGNWEETTVSDVVVANPVAVGDLSNVNVDLIVRNHNHLL